LKCEKLRIYVKKMQWGEVFLSTQWLQKRVLVFIELFSKQNLFSDTDIWDMMPCSLINGYQCFAGV